METPYFSNSSRCICGDGDATTEHLLLHCQHFANSRSTLLEQVSDILKTDIKVLQLKFFCTVTIIVMKLPINLSLKPR